MKTVYLLPCSCGKKLQVDAGQAGAKVPCACGKQLTVPTFRGLRDLETETVPLATTSLSALQPHQRWSATRGMLFSAGLLISAIAAILVCYHLYKYWDVRDGGEAMKRDYIESARHDVEHLTPEQTLYEFHQHAADGLSVQGTPPWGQKLQIRDASRAWLIGALIGLAVGLVSIIGSLIMPRQRQQSS